MKNPLATVIAGIPPEMLGSLDESRGRNDGFEDRLLFVFPSVFPEQVWTEDELDQGDETTWFKVISDLHSLGMHKDKDGTRPHLVPFDEEAKAAWVTWFNAHNKEAMSDNIPSRCRGKWSKLEAYNARFSLILSRLRLAMDPEETELLKAPARLIDVQGASLLAAYFKTNAMRIQFRVTAGTGDPDAKAIIRWILRNNLTEFRLRDLRHVLSGRFPTPESAQRALAIVARMGAIRPKIEKIDPHQPGRRPTQAYEVNPLLELTAKLPKLPQTP